MDLDGYRIILRKYKVDYSSSFPLKTFRIATTSVSNKIYVFKYNFKIKHFSFILLMCFVEYVMLKHIPIISYEHDFKDHTILYHMKIP